MANFVFRDKNFIFATLRTSRKVFDSLVESSIFQEILHISRFLFSSPKLEIL